MEQFLKGCDRTFHLKGNRLCQLLALAIALVIGLGYPGLAEAATQVQWSETTPNQAGFRKAIEPKDWTFPADFGPHPDYQTEWWYYTGNLETETHQPLGFQLTVFRRALSPQSAATDSPWRTPQIFSAHFTVSDIQHQRFYHQERFSRGSVGLAGAEADPYQVWIHDWSAQQVAPDTVQLQANTESAAIDLKVRQSRPPVLQGNQGLSQKGQEPGNASYYYSLIQQPTAGTVRIGEQTYQVTGVTWKDHEYSTSALSSGTVGWDWFSAQMDDGSALMLYRLRHEDGATEPTSGGKFISAKGEVSLHPEDWQLEVTDTWVSPHSQATYPAQWQLRVPKLDLSLQITPQMADQELNTSTATYWEGAVSYNGDQAAQPITGQGYVELTGYADRLDSLLGER